jgi:hypothetical protein
MWSSSVKRMMYKKITMGNEIVKGCKIFHKSGSHFKILDFRKVIRSSLVRAHEC